MKVVIIGGGAGGAMALSRIKRLDDSVDVTIYQRSKDIALQNEGLCNILGKNNDRIEYNRLKMFGEKQLIGLYGGSYKTRSEVISVDRKNKKILVRDLDNSVEYTDNYDKLILATGSISKSEINIDAYEEVFDAYSPSNYEKLKEYILDKSSKSAVVVGAGEIGISIANRLIDMGLQVTIVEQNKQILSSLDIDFSQIVENLISYENVKLILDKKAVLFDKSDSSTILKLETKEEIKADVYVLATGLIANSRSVENLDLELNECGAIKVDEFLQTVDENIYAIGDVASKFISGCDESVCLNSPSLNNKEARAVADNIVLGNVKKIVPNYNASIVKLFDFTVAWNGLSEKKLNKLGKKYGLDYFVTTIHPQSHIGFSPNARFQSIKLIYDISGKVLGSQIVGYTGVDKRIDILSTVLKYGGTIYDLQDIEVAYSPDFGVANDPINTLGYVCVNQIENKTRVIKSTELDNSDNLILLDVREPEELIIEKLSDDIVNIPLSEIRDRIDELDKSKKYLLHCKTGIRGYIADRILRQNGFDSCNLMGGIKSYLYAHPHDEKDAIEEDFQKNVGVDNNDKIRLEDIDMENIKSLDLCGLSCPGPIMKVAIYIKNLEDGEVFECKASDPGFMSDIGSWCRKTGNTLVNVEKRDGKIYAVIQKGNQNTSSVGHSVVSNSNANEKTMIVFSGDLDKAIASFIIANGAAAMGNKVNMFFTFWGLNILRKHNPEPVKKDFISKMFGIMMPRGSKKLGLSKMNMGGMGAMMIRKVMENQNVESLESLIKAAMDSGIKMTACQMSMDVMGITKEELIDGVEIGGVAAMLEDSDNSNMNLFI